MRSIFTFIFVYLVNVPVILRSQSFDVTFTPVFGKMKLDSAAFPWAGAGDTLRINAFKFYVSGMELFLNGKPVWKEKSSFHLVDFRKVASLKMTFDLGKKVAFDQLCFNLGIDSVTNVSGALGGDLDPTIGMYWAWQSGYINLKLEGKSRQAPGGSFVFHLGGYAHPNNTLNRVTLPVNASTGSEVFVDVERFLEKANLKTHHAIMSPGAEAMGFSSIAAEMFFTRRE